MHASLSLPGLADSQSVAGEQFGVGNLLPVDMHRNISPQVPRCQVLALALANHALVGRYPTYIARAVSLGASDYVLKGSTRKVLIDTILAAAAGQSPSHAGELHRVARTMSSHQLLDDDQVQLTRRETQVLRHVALGLSNKAIGRSLEISIETVKEHVQNVLRKLAVIRQLVRVLWECHGSSLSSKPDLTSGQG